MLSDSDSLIEEVAMTDLLTGNAQPKPMDPRGLKFR